MTDQQQQNAGPEPPKDRFQAEFEALPLDQKFASLFRMEAATLTETVEYVFNSPAEVFGKVGDAISDFACKVETEFKKATQANQAQSQPERDTATETTKKGKHAKKNEPSPPAAE